MEILRLATLKGIFMTCPGVIGWISDTVGVKENPG